jgi:hypothetical protein
MVFRGETNLEEKRYWIWCWSDVARSELRNTKKDSEV